MTASNMTHSIFVYGSLRRGCYNNPFLNDAVFISLTKLSRFRLYKLCASYPTAVQTNESNDTIVVETYEINDEILETLDRLEGHPDSKVFHRIPAISESGVTGWIYCCTPEEVPYIRKSTHIESGDWLNQ